MTYPEQQEYRPDPVGPTEVESSPEVGVLADGQTISGSQELTAEQKKIIAGVLVFFAIASCVVFLCVAFLLNQPPQNVAQIRDIFIIFMAATSLLLAFVLVILIIQLARLINLLQNEVAPILDATNETMANLRGTTTFLTENLTEPVIKLNEYMAGFGVFWQAIGLAKRPSKSNSQNNSPTKGV
jgi:hypothetical protein